jgi:hypothetical protein
MTAPIHSGYLCACRKKKQTMHKPQIYTFHQESSVGEGEYEKDASSALAKLLYLGERGQTRRTRAALQPSSCLTGRGEGGGNEENASNALAKLLFHEGGDRAQNSRLVCRCITTGVT